MKPVLALHGFTGRPEDWRPIADRLAGVARIHAPTLLGHDPGGVDAGGAVEGSPTPFEDEVDRLAAWLAERSTEPVHLVGYSMGGRLAVGLLARHPRFFDGATLIGAHPGLDHAEVRRRRRADDEGLGRRLVAEGIESFVDFWQQLPLFASQARLAAEQLAAQQRRRLAHDPAGLARALERLGPGRMPDYWSWLPSFERPVTLLVGEEDPKYRRLAERMAAALPRARRIVVPGAGHNLVLEAPEAVTRVLGEDLRLPESAIPGSPTTMSPQQP